MGFVELWEIDDDEDDNEVEDGDDILAGRSWVRGGIISDFQL